ncbi:CMP-N-acetylneuraminate-beta-galactosamide-alpha-2,3-sialyltransferase 4 isoform X2 [Brachyhypopomus gauderio]|uniref:CMP-N-acetylneuraminate-beta-galactosamide- alpha-2,3-sialyltransferase 4 isoform X2 n=1 Tax=Brachyhypopomus gauderio TaxID=698409 RepID=UPI0040413E5A
MSLKTAKAWCIRLAPVVLLFISYYCSHVYLQSKPQSIAKYPCDKIMSQKKWESLNLNISRNEELFLKLNDFFWKEHSSALSLPYGLKGSESLLLKVLANYRIANYRMPTSIESLDCRTCVVIGNGFALKNSSLGIAIDRHDIVIRMNDAPVRGYEQDVGSKTTMRLFYPESASSNPDLQNDPDTLLVLVPFKQPDLHWLKEIIYNEKRVRKGFWKPPPQVWLGRVSQLRILHPCFLHLTASKLLQIPLEPKNQPMFVLHQEQLFYLPRNSSRILSILPQVSWLYSWRLTTAMWSVWLALDTQHLKTRSTSSTITAIRL